MAIAKLLNLDLCPRLYSLRDRHLHLPRRFEVPPAIVGIVQHDVSLEPIREGWDDLLRVAATIDEGWRSATDVLERFGTTSRTTPSNLPISFVPLSTVNRSSYVRSSP
jgi:TnpA family transposase